MTPAVGDSGAPYDLERWVLDTAPDAVAYAMTLVRDRATAEDVVQDCYCRLWRKANVYDLPRDGRKLLFRAVTNACLNKLTRDRPTLSLFLGDQESSDLPDRTAERPERALMRRELEQAIAASLHLLPPSQRAALELKTLGQSQDEIAAALQTSPGNVNVLIHRARRLMARFLAPFLEEKSG